MTLSNFVGQWKIGNDFHILDQQYRDCGWFSRFGPELEHHLLTAEVYRGQWSHIQPIVLSGRVTLIASSFHHTWPAWWIHTKNQLSEHPVEVMSWTGSRNIKFCSSRMKVEKALSYALWATSTRGFSLILPCGIDVIHAFKHLNSRGFLTGPTKRVGW